MDFAGGVDAGSLREGGDDPGVGGGGGVHVDAGGGVDGCAVLGRGAWFVGFGWLCGFGGRNGLHRRDLAGEVGAVCPAGVAVGADLDPVAVDFAGGVDAGSIGKLVDDLAGRRGGGAHVETAGGAGGGAVKGRTILVAARRGVVLGVSFRLGGRRGYLPRGEVAPVNPSGLAVDGDGDPPAVRAPGDSHLLTALGNGEDLASISSVATNVDRNSSGHGAG